MKNQYTFRFQTIVSIVLLFAFNIVSLTAQDISSNDVIGNSFSHTKQVDKLRIMPKSMAKVKTTVEDKSLERGILFYEDFTGMTELPPGWTVVGEGQDNWDVLPESYAGGEVPEVYMNFAPAFVGNSKLVTPIINTSGQDTLYD